MGQSSHKGRKCKEGIILFGLEICATHVDYYAERDKTAEIVWEYKGWAAGL